MVRISETGGACELCGRTVDRRTRHHLIPRSRHANKRVKRSFSREELQRTVPLCGACHRQIHHTLTEKELEREYNTVEALLSHPGISRFVRWVERKPHGVVARDKNRAFSPSAKDQELKPDSRPLIASNGAWLLCKPL